MKPLEPKARTRWAKRCAIQARVALAIAAIGSAAPVGALNEAANVGFETSPEPGTSWTAGGTTAATEDAFGRVTTEFRSGAASFQGRWTSTANNRSVARYISQSFTPTSAVQVALRGFYKRTGAGAVDSFTFRIALREGSPTGTVRSEFLYTNAANSTPPTDSTWQDSGLTTAFTAAAGTTYYVTLEWNAVLDSGESAGALVDDVHLSVSPAGLSASSAAGTTNVSLSWWASTGTPALRGTDPYQIHRGTASGATSALAFSSATSYVDTATSGNTTYYFDVSDFDTDGVESPKSLEVSVLTRPGQPSAPTFSAVGSAAATVSWNAPAGDAPSYRLERSGSSSGPWTTAGAGVTSPYEDSTLSPGTTYWYRVVPINASGDGVPSAASSVTTTAGSTTIAIGNGTAEPASQNLNQGQTLALDAFSLQTSSGTATITAVVVSLTNGSALSAISLQSTSACSGGTTYGTLASPANGNNTVATSGLAATTSSGGTDLFVCAAGGTVAAPTSVGGTVASVTATGYTSTDDDTTSATLTVQPTGGAVTTVGDGTNPASATMAPGSGARAVDAFTLQTSAGTDAVTSLTVTLAAGSWVGLSAVSVQNTSACNQATPYGSAAPLSNAVLVPLSGVTATTTLANLWICVAPKSHLAMPVPPGATYAVSGTVTAIGSSNAKSYGDTASATITIDNRAPADVTWGTVTPASGQVALSWTNPAADFSEVVILRAAGGPVIDAPVEGLAYASGNTIGASTVRYAGNLQTFNDSGLTNGQAYYYKAFAKDPYGNYAAGVAAGPAYPGAAPLSVGSALATAPMLAILNPGNQSVVSLDEVRGFRVQVRVFSPGSPGPAIGAVQLSSNAGQTWPWTLTRVAAHGTSPDLGVFEANVALAPAAYTLYARATNDGGATWVHSAPVGIVVKAARTGDGKLLVRDNASQLCSDCHAHKGHSSETLGTTYGAWATVCRDCHTPHGTTNLYLVPTQITPPPRGAAVPTPRNVVFVEKTQLANADRSGPCQVCHTQTTFFRADGSEPANTHPTSDCASCHKHTDGLKASCTDCHGTPGRTAFAEVAPPKDTCGNTGTSGGAGVNRVGGHERHLLGSASLTDGVGCAECHVPQPSRAGHPGTSCSPDPAQRAVMTWGTLARGTVDPWTSGTPASPAYDHGTQTCSSTYCHGQFKNSGVTSAVGWHDPVGCGSCHGLPPPQPTHSSTSTDCAQCHGTGYALAGVIGAARVTHVDGKLDVANLTCSTCHGTEGRTLATTIGATDPALLAAAPPTDHNGASSSNLVGPHQAHVSPAASGQVALPIACSECHTAAVNAYATTHSDSVKNVSFVDALSANLGGVTGAWFDGSPSSCTTYCHGDGFSAAVGGTVGGWTWNTTTSAACDSCHKGPPTDPVHTSVPKPSSAAACSGCHGTTVSGTGAIVFSGTGASATTQHIDGAIDTGGVTCRSCHGSATNYAPPVLANAANTNGVGAHQSHVNAASMTTRSAAYACTQCHPDHAAMNHASGGAPDMVWTASLAPTTVWADASSSCTTSYCHGGTAAQAGWGGTLRTPVWTDTGDSYRGCTACHGSPPPAPHVQNSSCGTSSCHGAGYSSTAVTGAALATHVDGTVNHGANTCTSCHGTAGRASNGVANTTYQPAAPPVDTTGASAVSDVQVGAHLEHVNGTRSRQVACTECHFTETPATNDYLHANGSTTVNTSNFGTLAKTGGLSPTYSGGATPTCSATYCHGNFAGGNGAGATPAWTTATTLTCAQCHPSTPTSARHGKHVAGGAGNYTFTCDECHASTMANDSSSAITTSANHVNGTKNWQFSTTLRATAVNQSGGSYSAGTCSATYCHSGGVSTTAGAFNPTASAALVWSTGAATCRSCHGWDAAAAPTIGVAAGSSFQGSAKHANHVANAAVIGANYACGDCHAAVVAPGTSAPVTSSANHVNGVKNVSVAARGSFASSEPYTGGSCTATYCHSSGQATPAYRAISWATGSLGCNGCHGTGNASGSPDYASGAAGSATANSHAKHTSNGANAGSCQNCHSGFVTAAGTAISGASHTNGARNVAILGTYDTNGATTNYDTTTKACSGVSCHGSGSPVWGGTLGCNSCHGSSTPRTAVNGADANLNAAPPVGLAGETLTTQRAVGAHIPHANQLTLRSSALTCAECHGGATHDGTKQVVFGAIGSTGGRTPTWNGTTCASTYCHAPGGTEQGGTNRTPSWTGTSQATCGTCHGAPPPLAATAGHDHPKNTSCASCHGTGYATAGVTSTAKNTHVNQSTAGGVDKPGNGCTACHGVLAGFAGASVNNTSLTAAPGYVGASTGRSVRGETVTTAPAVGAHDKHLRGTRLRTVAAVCADCHAVPANLDTAHATGTGTGGAHATLSWSAFVRTGSLTPTYAGSNSAASNTTAGTCASTYCHGKWTGNAAYAGTKVQPSWTESSTAAACGTCHKIAPTSSAHSAVTATTNCSGCHTGYNCTSGSLAACTVSLSLHMNGVGDASGGSCTGCHGATQGARRAVVADFSLNSHHVGTGSTMGGALTDNDCAVCHAEAVVASQGAAPTISATLHKNSLIDLRDADDSTKYFQYDKASALAGLTAATASSAGSAAWRYEMAGRTGELVGASDACATDAANCKKGLDRFCISCHDADGASSSFTKGPTGGTKSNPFADAKITNNYDQFDRVSVVDIASRVHETARTSAGGTTAAADRDSGYAPAGVTVRTADGRNDPPEGVFARHAIRGLSVSAYGTTNATWDTNTYWSNSTVWNSKSVMACADCHTNDGVNGSDGNAHGAKTEYMLKNANGTSLAEPGTTYANYGCMRCHASSYYAGASTHAGNGGDYQDYSSQIGAARVPVGNTGGNILGGACTNCHGGSPPNKTGATFPSGSTGSTTFGTIHGTSQVLGNGSATGAARPVYRFTNGNSMRYYNPGTWIDGSVTRGCYTIGGGDQWGGCTKHSGGTNYSGKAPMNRPLKY